MDAIRKTYFSCVVFWLMLRDVWRHIAELHLITELFCSIVLLFSESVLTKSAESVSMNAS